MGGTPDEERQARVDRQFDEGVEDQDRLNKTIDLFYGIDALVGAVSDFGKSVNALVDEIRLERTKRKRTTSAAVAAMGFGAACLIVLIGYAALLFPLAQDNHKILDACCTEEARERSDARLSKAIADLDVQQEQNLRDFLNAFVVAQRGSSNPPPTIIFTPNPSTTTTTTRNSSVTSTSPSTTTTTTPSTTTTTSMTAPPPPATTCRVVNPTTGACLVGN